MSMQRQLLACYESIFDAVRTLCHAASVDTAGML